MPIVAEHASGSQLSKTVLSSPTGFSTTPSSLAGGGYENTVAQDPNNHNDLAIGGDTSGIELSKDAGKTWVPTNQGFLSTASQVPQQRHIASLAFDGSDNLWAIMGNGTAGLSEIWELSSAQIGGTDPVWAQEASPQAFTVDGTNAGGGTSGWKDWTRPTGNLFGFSGSNVYAATEDGLVSDIGGTWSVTTPSSFWPSGDSGLVIPTGFAVDPAATSFGMMTVENQLGLAGSKLGLLVIQNLGTTTPTFDCQLVPSGDSATDPAQEVVAIAEHNNLPVKYAAYVAFGTDGLVRYTLPTTLGADPCGGSFYSTTPLVAASTSASDCYPDGFNAVAAVATNAGSEVWGGCASSSHTGTSTVPYNNELWRLAINDGTGTITSSEGLAVTGDAATLSDQYAYGTSNVPWWHVLPAAPTPAPPNVSNVKDELGNSQYATSQIVLQTAHNNVWVAGRSGVWTSSNAGATTMSGISFSPDVNGLESTYDFAVAGSPSTASPDAGVADHDWQALLSQNRLLTSTTSSYAALNQQPETANNVLEAVGYLPVSSGDPPLLVGDSVGVVSFNPDPEATTTSGTCTTGFNCWISLTAVPGGGAVYAVTAGYNGVGDVVILAAGPYQSGTAAGIYQMICTGTLIATCAGGTWSAGISVSNANLNFGIIPNQKTMSFYWPANSTGVANSNKFVYLYDGSTGLWGSNTHGNASSWTFLDLMTKIQTTGSHLLPVNQRQFAGFMVGSETTANQVYVTNGQTLFEYPNASTCFTTCGTGDPTTISFTTSSNAAPGPVQLDTGGDLFVADESFDGGTAALFELPSGSSSWSTVSDTPYKESVLAPNSMGISADSCPYLYFASQGQGVNVATGSGC